MHRNALATLAVAVFITVGVGTVFAETDILAPPYLLHKAAGVIVGVAHNAIAIRSMLPPGIEPVEELTGGVIAYTSGGGYTLAPYSTAYVWVDIKGFDSADGTKGRWMVQGIYGPDKVTAAIRKYYGWPVRVGTARVEERGTGKVGIGSLAGQDVIHVAVTPKPDGCKAVAGIVHFVSELETSHQRVVNENRYVGEACEAVPVSVDITAPTEDPMNTLKPVKLLWGVEFRDVSSSWSKPIPVQ
jgi:hypothetical protein